MFDRKNMLCSGEEMFSVSGALNAWREVKGDRAVKGSWNQSVKGLGSPPEDLETLSVVLKL